MKNTNSTYYLVSLGCAKNLVDSNAMMRLMATQKLQPVDRPGRAKYLIVNTCGFIEQARQESLQIISDLAQHKKADQFLIATGCMTQRYREELLKMVKGIDGMLGTRRWMDILDVIQAFQDDRPTTPYLHFPLAESMGRDEKDIPAIAIQGKSSYLKIADGCRRPCAYCAIPLIKGTLVSRPLESIVRDAQLLQTQGIKEINLIAQDVTDYGHEFGLKDGLVTLLKELVKTIPEVPWIRLLYTFPGYISDSLIETMAENHQILPYLDLPLQHADRDILKSMQRPSDTQWVKDTIHKMRTIMPDLALRTTFIVGYPGETEPAFQNLMNFVDEIRFDHIGVFTYSKEVNTPGESLGDPIPQHVKDQRLETLITHQAKISLEKNQTLIGKQMDILIEGKDDDQHILVGRSQRDAPEIDGLVIVEGQGEVGDLLPVRIHSAMTHDLIGTLVT